MAEGLDDAEFWLPTEFLTDDDILMDNTHNKKKDGLGLGLGPGLDASKPLFPYGFPNGFGSFGFSSDLSSPVESVVGSTETESDEEDFLAGLTRQIAHSTLEDDFRRNDRAFGLDNKSTGWVVSGSPQSTLCAIGSGCGCRQGSSRGSPNCQSRVSSPPATWDLLYAAAGEVARMRMNEEMYGFGHDKGLFGHPNTRKPSPMSVPVKNPNFNSGFYHQQSLSHQKLQATQYHHQQQLKQHQIMKQQQQQQQSSLVWGGQTKGNGQYNSQMGQSRVRNNGGGGGGRPLGLSPSAWPPLQQTQQKQQNGSGMRAVFLGNTGAKRECVGTGVFLPRRSGTVTDTRKKPGCSTVLLPARVVQALNLNLDDMGAAQPQLHSRFNGSFTPDTDVALRLRNNNVINHQRRSIRPQPGMNHEIRLPQEWTY